MVKSDHDSFLLDVVERLQPAGEDAGLQVARSHRLRGLFIVEGIEAVDNWTECFEPVRRRLVCSRRWKPVQEPAEAEVAMDSFLRKRPYQL